MQAQPLRPIGANPIEISDYLKPIADSRTILVKKVIEDYFEKNKLVKTLSELKRRNKFLEPDGVKPDEDRTLQTVLDRIKKNPDKSFTMSDVWYPCNIVYVFKQA